MVSLIDLDFDPDLLDLTFETCSSACEATVFSSSSELNTTRLFCLFEGRESIPSIPSRHVLAALGELAITKTLRVYLSDLVVSTLSSSLEMTLQC